MPGINRFRELLAAVKWGNLSLICLYISLVSGIIVGIHYDPGEPFYSASALDIIVPFGGYFRSLHFYSSQFFFLFAILHYLAVFDKTESYGSKPFVYLILTLPAALMLLFTGYVLRGDSTGFSAGMIAENIILSVPLAGEMLNNILFSITDYGMQKVYLHHVISFDFLFLLFSWDHLRRYKVRISRYLVFTGAVLCFSLVVAAPLDPEELGIFYITGPWFFLGLQELLRYLPPFIAGVLVPSSLIAALVLLRKGSPHVRKVLIFVLLWLAGYGVLTWMALSLHR